MKINENQIQFNENNEIQWKSNTIQLTFMKIKWKSMKTQ